MAPFESWGRVPQAPPARVERLTWRDSLPALPAADGPVLAYGLGRSYGDVCLNGGGVLLVTAGLERIILFDRSRGLIRAEAGVTLADILSVIVPAGWFLPVTPGTKWVTLGGAVANDIHGKNHHVAGTFGRHVTRLELVRTDLGRMELTPADDLFRATIGGLGLTGLITWVEFELQAITSDVITARNAPFASMREFVEASRSAGERSPYVVAWVDSGRPEAKGVLMEGAHAGDGSLPPRRGAARRPRASIPIDLPTWALARPVVKSVNRAYFARKARAGRFTTNFDSFFYPLDGIAGWNRGYGRRGLLQHQSVVPEAPAASALLRRIAESGAASFVTVLKTFGGLPSPGTMSFPRPGVTLAVDFANRGPATVRILHELDAIVLESGGRVYPAKDACMTAASFRAFYPEWERFAAFVDPAFSSSFWRRVTSDA